MQVTVIDIKKRFGNAAKGIILPKISFFSLMFTRPICLLTENLTTQYVFCVLYNGSKKISWSNLTLMNSQKRGKIKRTQ